MKIARVFVRKTNMTPTDPDVYYDTPDLFTPYYDKVLISVVFTLAIAWKNKANKVIIGGPAYDDQGGEFTPGLFLKEGITITSRGCPNSCLFCFVPKREGKIRELYIHQGNIIQDNNLLGCSKSHIDKVFAMLKTQKAIRFVGGFEAARVTDEIVEKLRGLSIKEIWLAYDHADIKKPLEKAISKLSKYFSRDKLRCYVLIGYEGDTLEKAESRLRWAWEIGTKPFAQRFRNSSDKIEDTFFYKNREWALLTRTWSRPASIYAVMNPNRF